MIPDQTPEDPPDGVGEVGEGRPDRARDAQPDLHAPAAITEPEAPNEAQERHGSVDLFSSDDNLRPLAEIEADIIRLAIGHYRGRMSEVARRLGIGRSTLYRKLADLDIDTST